MSVDGDDTDARTDGSGEDVVSTTRRTFEDIDWTTIDAESRRINPLTGLWWGLLAVLVGGLVLDGYWRLAPDIPDVPGLGLLARETGGAFAFPVVGTVAPLTWLYALTLLFVVFQVVVPLVRDRRMTMYYWREFRKNRMAVLSLGYLIVVFLVGHVSAYSPPHQNTSRRTGPRRRRRGALAASRVQPVAVRRVPARPPRARSRTRR